MADEEGGEGANAGSHEETQEIEHEEIEVEAVTAVLYLVVMLTLGLFVKHCLKRIPLPYSGLLLVRKCNYVLINY